MSTAEIEAIEPFEAVDPLSGILHPAYRAIEEAKANRSRWERIVDRYRAWRRAANEPNIRTYETELIVDEEELKQPLPPLSAQQQRDIERASAAFEGYDPRKVNREPLSPFFGSDPSKK